MKTLHTLCAILALQTSVCAVEITVGSTRLTIPAPEGFSLVTSEMQPYADFAKRFVAPQNERFALFLPDTDVALAKAGEIPDGARRFEVQVTKQIIKPVITKTDFAEIKKMIKTQNDEIMRKAEAEIPGFLKKLTDGLSKDYDVDMSFSSLQILPMPAHGETDRSLAFSTLVRYNVDAGTGKIETQEGIVTATLVHVKGKVLLLYVHADKPDLEWSKTAAKTLSDQIIAQNPSDAAMSAQESKPRSSFDWNSVLRSAIIGAAIGGLVGLIKTLLKKKKPNV